MGLYKLRWHNWLELRVVSIRAILLDSLFGCHRMFLAVKDNGRSAPRRQLIILIGGHSPIGGTLLGN